jgi:hypothetical protein
MCSYGYDLPDVYNEHERIAKKEHICSECGRIIAIKEKYKYHFGVWEGRAEAFKTCAHCLIVQNYIRDKCDSSAHGGLEEEVYEHALDYNDMKLYRLLVGMRRQWRKFNSESLMTVSR